MYVGLGNCTDVGSNSFWDRELMMVAIEVNIVPIFRVWWKNKLPDPDIMKLGKRKNYLHSWVSESLHFHKLQQKKTLSQFVDIPEKAVV